MTQFKAPWPLDLDDGNETSQVSDVPWWAALAAVLGLLSVSALFGGFIYLAARLAD